MADDSLKVRLGSAAPVFLVSDVAATMTWYQERLGFEAYSFPSSPPHAFCVLVKDGVEIMLQGLAGYTKPRDFGRRDEGVWDLYIRMDGVTELYEALSRAGDVKVLEPLRKQFYGDTEFVVEDPNGYVLVFGEIIR